MEDIEDMGSVPVRRESHSAAHVELRRRQSALQPRAGPVQVHTGDEGCGADDCCGGNGDCAENKAHADGSVRAQTCSAETASYVPGTERIYVWSQGCSHNMSDGEYMAGQLREYGYELVQSMEEADLVILNSCTVKNPSESHFLTRMRKARAAGCRVVAAGCVPQGEPRHSELADVSLIGVQQIDRVVEVVEQTLRGNTVRLLKQRTRPSLALPKARRNELIEILVVNAGCLGSCTYCKTKHARGKLASYEPDAIVARAQSAIAEGVVELWVTSEDLGAYGRDIGTNLPALLERLVEVLPSHVRMRLGMTNPPYILEHIDAMARVLAHPQVYSFLHVPVQSGSDDVLLAMRREYTVGEFRRVVDGLRAQVPGVTISTDIICGFPGSTPHDHELTMELVREYRFPILNISQFYPRPGTPAARMKKVQSKEVKRRSREVSALFNHYRCFGHLVGTRQRVLVTEHAADGVNYVAHTKGYVQVIVPPDARIMGKMIDVDITEAGKFFVRGVPCRAATRHTVLVRVLTAALLLLISLAALWHAGAP